jgi:hypothetical protein
MKTNHNKYIVLTAQALLPLLSLLVSQPCKAENNNNLVIAGLQASSKSTYAFSTAIVPFGDAKLGQGWYQKAGLSWLTYRYDGTLNSDTREVSAKAPGIEAGIGHMWNNEDSRLDLSATLGYRHIEISPFTPAGDRDGNVFILNPQIQASRQFNSSIDAELLANYAIGLGSSFTRMRLGWKPVAGWRTGLEGIWQEGKNYRITQQGLFLSKTLASGVTLEINAGQAKPQNDSASAYIGLSFASTY